MTKFGIDQIDKPAPNWIGRLLNTLIIIVMPAMATFVLAIPNDMLSADNKNFFGALATFGLAILKALQFLLGEENPDKDSL